MWHLRKWFAELRFRLHIFDERMVVLFGSFTIFTEIKVSANNAFVSDSDNWMLATAITGDLSMDHLL